MKQAPIVLACPAFDDVAQQTFWGFFESVRAGRLPKLVNRQQLLALLTHITACQAINQIKHELGVRGRVQGESVLDRATPSGQTARGLEQFEGKELLPQEKAILDHCYRHYLDALPEHLRKFAELYLAGLTHQEIADRLNCTERTVDRKFVLIMARWQRLASQDMSSKAN